MGVIACEGYDEEAHLGKLSAKAFYPHSKSAADLSYIEQSINSDSHVSIVFVFPFKFVALCALSACMVQIVFFSPCSLHLSIIFPCTFLTHKPYVVEHSNLVVFALLQGGLIIFG